jgi:ribosomal protein S18 acetylase RimI-like enzyme
MSRTPPEFNIRDARIEDAALLGEAEREIAKIPGRLVSRPSELKDESIHEKIVAITGSQRGKFVVIESAGQIVGHAFLDPWRLEAIAHVVELTIAIHEGHQGKGFGRALLSYLIDWAKSNPKLEKINLHVRSSNTPAIALYEKMGFIVEGIRVKMIKLGPGAYVDNIAMALWVGP